MDFLITNNQFSTCAMNELRLLKTDLTDDNESFLDAGSFSAIFFGGAIINSSERVYFFDGQFSYKDDFYHPFLKNDLPDFELLKNIVHSKVFISVGVFSIGEIDLRNDRFILMRDRISQYPIFYYSEGDKFTLSNNLKFIESLHPHLKRDGYAAIENAIFGGVTERLSLAGVKFIPHGTFVEYDGKLKFNAADFYSPTESYDFLIRKAHVEITNHIKSCVSLCKKYGMKITTDITGGKDSRFILGALINSTSSGDLSGRCMGSFPNPDANVAGGILERFSIKKALFPIIETPLEYDLMCSSFLFGGSMQADVNISPIALENMCHFQGTFGGLAGSVGVDYFEKVSSEFGYYSPELHSNMMLSRRTKSKIVELVNPNKYKELSEGYAGYINSTIESGGFSIPYITHEMYSRVRCRTHFGLQFFFRNKTRILPSPLACYTLVAARNSLTPEELRAGKILFDLCKLNKNDELLYMPMANKKWSETLIPDQDYSRYEAQTVIDWKSSNLSKYNSQLYDKLSLKPKLNYKKLIKKNVSSKDSHLIHSGKIGCYQSFGKFILENYPDNSLVWDYWNKSKVCEYVSRNPSDFRNDGLDVEILGLFVSSALYLTNNDSQSGVFSVERL